MQNGKCKTMVSNRSGKVLKGHDFHYEDKKLDLVQDFTYLGIDITASGSFSKAVSSLTDKANKAMYPLIDTIFKFNLNITHSLDLLSKLIKSMLLYGSEIWSVFSNHQLDSISQEKTNIFNYFLKSKIEKPNLKFCKTLLGVKRNCSSLAVLGELGQFPILISGITHVVHQNRFEDLGYAQGI